MHGRIGDPTLGALVSMTDDESRHRALDMTVLNAAHRFIDENVFKGGQTMTDEKLQQQIREITDRLERIRRDLAAPLDRDLGEQAIQLENREVLLELERVESARLAELKAAARRQS
jgi:hypothetical protein